MRCCCRPRHDLSYRLMKNTMPLSPSSWNVKKIWLWNIRTAWSVGWFFSLIQPGTDPSEFLGPRTDEALQYCVSFCKTSDLLYDWVIWHSFRRPWRRASQCATGRLLCTQRNVSQRGSGRQLCRRSRFVPPPWQGLRWKIVNLLRWLELSCTGIWAQSTEPECRNSRTIRKRLPRSTNYKLVCRSQNSNCHSKRFPFSQKSTCHLIRFHLPCGTSEK